MIRAAVIAIALAGCGDNGATGDAGTADAAPTCSAAFTGNFAETSSSPADCATVTGTTLAFTIPSTTLATSLNVSIDLGAPAAGMYSPGVVQSWSAIALERIGDGGCDYSAGSAAVPTGNFALTLRAIDPAAGTAHGALEITQYVLVFPGTLCGDAATETIDLQF